LIEMIARDVYFLDECDRRKFKAIHKVKEAIAKGPGVFAAISAAGDISHSPGEKASRWS
jgi:hypothetical protein